MSRTPAGRNSPNYCYLWPKSRSQNTVAQPRIASRITRPPLQTSSLSPKTRKILGTHPSDKMKLRVACVIHCPMAVGAFLVPP
ncbi:hypothetical protein DAEQUDRAFT_88778 [Daedalea quercina L-15889]|uniref:Uncharacterized protein n=1 Tax=Daedalea quercina L-15889 TaxID=1314783 RepID=A0A165KYT1_9APHY|nr:hypothetical protein DAEQUDRAFT_88778 [Daedalea quercina L-15889]